jgi:hypothetical protein
VAAKLARRTRVKVMRDDELFFDPADAERLRRGWPYTLVLDPSHKDNKRAAAATTSFIEAIDPKYFAVMPDEVARRFLRTGCVTQFRPRPGLTSSQAMTACTEAAIADGAPVLADEALALLREALRASREIYEFKVSTFLFTVEQIAGSEATVVALCDGFEALVAEAELPWRGSANFPYWCASLLHWPLLRVPREARDKARARIDAVIEAAEDRAGLAGLAPEHRADRDRVAA